MRKIQKMPALQDRHWDKISSFGKEKLFAVRGRWRDKITYADGTEEVTPWRPNQIQNVAAIVAAALFRRYDETAEGTDWDGITYMGIGRGNVTWDTVPPTQDAADTILEDEFVRKAIAPSDMSFSDGAGTPQLPESRFIMIVVTLAPSEANDSLREFALFGGDATGTVNTGQMINWIVHNRFDKDSSITIQRTVEFEFLEP